MHTHAGAYSDTWTYTDVTGNYNNASGTVIDTINKANASIDVTGYTGVYDGQVHGATGTASGVNSEDLSGLLHLGSTFTNVPGGTATWTFEGNDNYNSATGTVDITITKANATFDVIGYTLTYSGSADTVAGTATGVLGETLTGLDLTGTVHSHAGVYSDTWTFTDSTGNYNNASGTVTDTINKANTTLDVTGYTGVYDGQAHGATGTATGVSSEDLSSLLHLGSTFTNVPGGTAAWTFEGNDNYNSATGSVAIVITKANAVVNVLPYSSTYTGTAHVATATITGVLGEALTGLDLTGTVHSRAGVYSDTWNFTDSTGNYNNASGTVTDTINKANATFDVIGYTGVYDGAAHVAPPALLPE